MAVQSSVDLRVQESAMSKVSPFHTDTGSPKYHPRERYVYHDESECRYGKQVKLDGKSIDGIGTDPAGNPRQQCDSCKG
jgi:hypothetical protein